MAASIIDQLLNTAKDTISDPDQLQQFTGGSIDTVEEFMRKTEHTGPKNYGRGFLAGVIGGMAGVAVKMIVDRYVGPNTAQVENKATDDILGTAEKATGINLGQGGEEIAEAIVEMGIGMLIGGVYGLIVEAMPEAKVETSKPADVGGVFATVQQLAMPALGIVPAAAKDVAMDKVQNLAGHIAFGATTEVVRRASRYYMEQ
jgi:uncharacterized membrane protein YagU involved in acid resistance